MRVRLCVAAAACCARVPYVALTGISFPPGSLNLPHFITVTLVVTLG